MLSRLPTRCKFCKVKFTAEERGKRLHPECIEPWTAAFQEKQKQKAIKERKAKAKVERAIDRRKKQEQKTNGERKAGAQAALNRWVVHGRDKDQPCISCGRFHDGAIHGGHYRSRGSAPHLALDPRNVHRQCYPCNVQLHGNLINYRLGLIERYGVAFVEELEVDQKPRHHTGADYDAIKADFVQRLKQLKKENA